MDTEVTRSTTGDGVMIRVVESDADIAERRQRRRQLKIELRARAIVTPQVQVTSSTGNRAARGSDPTPS